jgi:ABC-2 type transport system permease protein
MCTNLLLDYARLAAAYTRINVRAQLEYRGAFFSQIAAMFLNDGMWVVFWIFFFTRFPVLRGWTLTDVMSLWAVVTAGFGIAFGVMGNAHQLAPAIARGELDLWLSHPRAVLPHLLLGRSVPTAWGDAAFGYAVYFAFIRPDFTRMMLFVLLTLVVATAFVGFGVMAGSLGFYIGNASALADQWRFALITFSTYPPTLFDGVVKLMLFTVIPAAFVSYVPVEALRSLSIVDLLLAVGGALAVLGAGAAMFYHGLRRYESGNLIAING